MTVTITPRFSGSFVAEGIARKNILIKYALKKHGESIKGLPNDIKIRYSASLNPEYIRNAQGTGAYSHTIDVYRVTKKGRWIFKKVISENLLGSYQNHHGSPFNASEPDELLPMFLGRVIQEIKDKLLK